MFGVCLHLLDWEVVRGLPMYFRMGFLFLSSPSFSFLVPLSCGETSPKFRVQAILESRQKKLRFLTVQMKHKCHLNSPEELETITMCYLWMLQSTNRGTRHVLFHIISRWRKTIFRRKAAFVYSQIPPARTFLVLRKASHFSFSVLRPGKTLESLSLMPEWRR